MVVAGLVFMVYPYFAETITSLLVVGVVARRRDLGGHQGRWLGEQVPCMRARFSGASPAG